MPPVKNIVTAKIKRGFERVDLVSKVTDWLREEIISGRLAVGSRLPSEGKLAEQMGVSRNVVREAMRNLRSQGLIEISQGRSPHVKESDSETAVIALESLLRDADNKLLHLTEARSALEAAIAVLACRRRTDSDLRELRNCLEQLMAEKERPRQMEYDYQFHRHLAAACGNPVFTFLLEALSGLIRRSQQTTYPKDGLAHAVEGHKAILAAVAARDEGLAGEEMRRHLAHAEKTLRDEIQAKNKVDIMSKEKNQP